MVQIAAHVANANATVLIGNWFLWILIGRNRTIPYVIVVVVFKYPKAVCFLRLCLILKFG